MLNAEPNEFSRFKIMHRDGAAHGRAFPRDFLHRPAQILPLF